MAEATTHIFSSAEHSQLVPYLAALHASCITHDRMIGTFLPPLHHEKLLSWWKERIAEVNAGTRVIVLLLHDATPRSGKAIGTDLVGVAMLDMPESETAPFRGCVEKVLVSNKARGQGGARALMNAIEAEALRRGRTLLVSFML
jgi:GNAT superfamily N-acetyltransferase